ncbi:MAG: SDR family NAD(P)-dependent oxidoreductase [SAR324 cluster bacterium]
MARLGNKVAIITGATSGIGRRTAELFVAEGARVVVCGRRTELGKALEAELGKERCHFVTADVSQESEVKALVEACVKKWGRVDCLFNNAGGPAPHVGIDAIQVESFDACFASLVRSVMLGMKHVAPLMMKQGSGSIINNGSVAGLRTGFSSITYSAAKAAVIQMTKCVAMQLGEKNVRVNSISPGAIPTGIFGKAAGMAPERAERTAATVKAAFAGAQPIPRAGAPDDIAHAAVFLASDESSFVNGQDLAIDGGMIAGRFWSVQQQATQGLRAAMAAVE